VQETLLLHLLLKDFLVQHQEALQVMELVVEQLKQEMLE
tara:strand:- start:288 stop:404 length:117 start_codon:yes stop_codon:yes gene_type:complete